MRNHRHTYLLSFLLLACLYSNFTFAQAGCTTSVAISSNSPVCSGNTIFLSATVSGGTPGYSYSWTGPNGFTSTTASPSISNSTTAASGTYAVTITDSKGCAASASSTVTVNQTPIVAAISGPNGGCAGSTIQLSSSTSGGSWTSSNTSVATIDNTGLVTIVAGGTSTITYTVTNNGCSTSVTKTIGTASVFMAPDVLECNNGVRTYDSTAANPYRVKYDNPATGSFLWTVTNGGTGSNVTDSVFKNPTTPTGPYPSLQLVKGNWYIVAVSYTSNGVTCTASQKVYKQIYVSAAINGTHDTTVCYTTNPVPISVTTSIVVTKLSWTTSGTGTFSNNGTSATTTTYTPSAADKASGSVTLTVTASTNLNANGNCGTATATDQMILRIYPNNTGTNSTTTICSNQTINYTPVSTISGSTFSWVSSVTSGSVSGNSPSGTGKITDSLINLSNTSNGVVNYTITPYAFTPSNISCPGTPFNYVVTLQPKPAVNITNNTASLCTGTTTNIQFNSSITGSTYTWTSSVISGTASGNSSNSTASSTNTINDVLTNGSTTANATVRYRITAIPPTGCSRTDSTDVLVYALPTKAVAGTAQSLCSATSTMLTGNTPIIGTGTWTLASGPSGSSFSNPNSPSTAVNGLTPGTYKFVWSIVNGSCAASTDTVTVTNSATTVAGTLASPATVCAGSNTGTLTLSGYTGSILNWQSSTDGGTTWTNIANTTNTYTYNNLTTSTFYKAVVQSGACSTASSPSVAITVTPASSSGILAANATVCAASNSGTLNLTGYTGTVVRWESSIDGASWTSIANTTSSYSYANITATTLYRAVVQSGSCGIINSNNVTITVNPQTVAGTLAASNTVCATSNNGTLTLSGYTGNILNWQSSTDNGATWASISNTTNTYTYTNLAATTQYRAQVQSGVCNAIGSNAVTITVMQPVTVANAGPNQTLCSVTSTTLAANVPTVGTGTWTQLPGDPTVASFTNVNNPYTTVNNLTTGTYHFQWTIANSPCTSSSSTVVVTIDPLTVPGTLASPATVCATANTGTLTLSGYTSTILGWQSSTNNGTTWTNIANTTASNTYNNLNATTLFRAQVQSGSCASQYSNNVTITVTQPVTNAVAGPNQALCNVTSTTMAANAPTVGTGTWTQLPGGPSIAIFTNANNPFTTVTNLVPGTYQFQWTIANSPCASSQSVVQVHIDPPTVPGTLASPATVCATSNFGTLTLSGYTSSILQWESSINNGTTWTPIANTANTYNYSNIPVTTQYRALVQNGVCASQYSNTVTITALQAVSSANAGPDQQLCNVTSATMAATLPTSGTGTWTQVSGPPGASYTDLHDPKTTVNGLTFGAYQFKWTVSNGYCANSVATVNITVNTPSVPGTLAANATVCATSNAGSLNLSGYSTTILRWESSVDNGNIWTGIANTAATYAYSGLTATTQFRAVVQNTVCPALPSNTVTITVFQPVTVANAGPNQTLCNVSSATLAANAATSGSGTWTKVSGPSAVTFTNPNNPTTTVTGLTAGAYTFQWTISNGVCASTQSTVQVQVDPPTTPGTLASPATVCATANAGTLTLSGYTSAVTHWESSTDNGNTWGAIISTSNTYTYSNLTATTLFRAQVQSGSCATQYSNNVAITVLPAVTNAIAGPNQTLCNVTATTLAGNIPTSGTGTWTKISGPTAVTFTNPNDPNTMVSGLATGTYQFQWTISNGVCASSQSTMQVEIDPPTVPGTLASPATVCSTGNAGTLTLSGYTSSILKWQSSTDNGNTWLDIANTGNTYAYSSITQNTLYRASVKNGVCAAQYSNNVAITVLQPVTVADAGPDQQLCNVTSTALAANTPASGTGTWSFVSGPTAVTFTDPNNPTTTVYGLTTGNYQLKWTITNGPCASSQKVMNITVYAPSVPGTLASDATVCATVNGGTVSLSGYSTNILRWESSIDNGNSWTNIANTASTYNYSGLTATTKYRALVQNGNCPALYSNLVTVNVIQPVSTANAGPDQNITFIFASAQLNAVPPTSGTGTWSQLSGPTNVSFVNTADPKTTITGLTYVAGSPATNGVYKFRWTVSNGVCANSYADMTITVAPPTNPGVIGPDQVVCRGINHGTLTLTGYDGTILRWEDSTSTTTWQPIASTVGANTPTYTFDNLLVTTYFRALVQKSGGQALYSGVSATITVVQPVTPSNAGPDQNLCSTTTTTLAGNTPTSGTGTWSFVSGPSTPTIVNPFDPNTIVNGLGVGTYQFAWTIANGICAASTTFVNVIVHPLTVPGNLVTPATVCANLNSGNLSLSGYTGGILRWESSTNNGTTWTNITNTANTYAYSNISATTEYRVLVQNSPCPSLYSNIVTISALPAVTTAKAGPTQDLCNVTSATLAGNTPTSGTGTWSFVSGPTSVTFNDVHNPTTDVYGLTKGTYQFMWTISNALCTPSTDVVTINVHPPTVAGSLAAPATVCANSNNGTLILTGYTGTINKWQSSTNNGTTWTDITNTGVSYNYANLTANTQFRAEVQNSVCSSLVSNAVTIAVVQPVTSANAGPDQQLCNVASATLAANNPTSGTGTWTQVSGPSTGTFTNPNAYNTTVNSLVAGTYIFQWTISNNICTNSQSTVKVTVYAPTNAGVLAAPATVCATSNTGTLNLTGHTGTINKWQSSTNNGTTWTDITNTTASYTYTGLTVTTLFRAEVEDAVCPALPSNNVTITVLQPVTASNAGPDQQLCNTTSTSLAANVPTSGTGVWSQVSGPTTGSFVNNTDPHTVVNGLTTGTYVFQWTISNSTCANSQSTVKVTVYPATVAGTLAAPATVCATSNNGTLNLTGYTGTINKWQSSINNGSTWTDITNTTANYTYNSLTTNTQFRAEVQNAVCPALVSNVVTITVIQPVTAANAGPDQNLCNVASATLAANNPTSGTGTWTQVSGPSTASFNNLNAYNTTINSLVAGTYVFQWTISNNTCASSQSTMKVTVYAATNAGTLAAPATVCVTSNTGTLNLTGYTGTVNKWQSSIDNGTTWADIANTTANYSYSNLTTNTLFRAEIQNAVCAALQSNNVTITVLQPVTIANAGPDQQLCNVTSATLAANNPTSGTGIWSLITGPSSVTFNRPTDPHTTVQGLQTGTYQLAWTIFNAACTASTSTVKIAVYASTVAGSLASPATVCATTNTGTLNLSGNTGGVNKWQSSIDNGTTWADIASTASSYTYTGLTTTTQFRVQVQNGVCLTQTSTPVTITVLQPVTTAKAGPAQQLCNVSVVKLAGNTPSSGTGTWSQLSGPASVVFADVHNPATSVSGLTAGTYKFEWTISNALCADSKDSVAVTVFPLSNGGKLTADAFVCVTGNAGTLQLAGYTGNILRWEFTTDSGTNWTNINNLTTTYSYNNLTTTTQYRALVQSGPCNTSYSNIVTIRVQPASVGGRLFSGSKAVCATANTDSIRLNGYTGVVQHWEFSTDKGANWTSFINSNDTYTYTNLTATTWFRVLIQSGACSSVYSDTLVVQVDSATVAGKLASDAVVCYNSNSGSIQLSGRTGSVLRWEFSTDSTRSWNAFNNNTSDVQQYNNLLTTTWYRTWVQNGACASMATNVVTITTMQPVTIAHAGPNQLLCDGSSRVTLAANLPTSGVGRWSMASGPSTPSFLNILSPNTDVSGLQKGVYKFVWTIANDVCNSSSDTVTITIDKLQTGFRLSTINDCGKTTFFFTDTTNTSFGIQSWKWYTPGVAGDTVRTRNNSIAYTADGMQSIALTVQSNSGCVNTRQANYKVTVFDFPQANINAVTEICKTQFMRVSPDVHSKDSIAYFLWNLGNGKKSQDSVVTVQYVEDGNYTVKLTVATINRCFDSAYKAITVHPIPAVTITSSINVCKGDTATLKADGATSYIWSDQNNNILCSNCQVLKVQPGSSSQYKVVGVSQYGCSEIQTTNLHLVQPLKMLAAKGDTICYGQSKQLFAAGANSYTWYPETGLSNKNAATPVASPEQTTTYHVIGKDQYGCFADTAEVKMVVGLPTAIHIGKDTVMSAGDVLQIKTVTERPDIVKWAWYGSSSLSCYNCPTPQLKVGDDVSLICRATNRYGCISIDTLNIKTFCPGTLVFIPNAFSPDGDGINDVLMIQGKGVKVIKSFRIFNRWGEVVFEKMNFQPGDPAYAWDGKVRGKPATPDVFVYICEVICDKGVPSFFKGNITILK